MASEVNSFVSREKLDILATAVADNMPYVRASKQSYPQQDLKGKKFGAKVSEYLTDAGTVTDGIVADPDAVHERQIDAFVQNRTPQSKRPSGKTSTTSATVKRKSSRSALKSLLVMLKLMSLTTTFSVACRLSLPRRLAV